MISRIRKYINEGSYFACLEVSQSDGQTKYSLIEVKKESGELHIGSWQTDYELERLLSNLAKNIPLCLIIKNDNVLTKLTSSAQKDPQSALLEAFPDLDLNAFYYEIFQEDFKPIISIIKKPIVDDLIRTIENSGISLVEFHLGITPVQVMLHYLNFPELHIANTELEIQERKITAIRTMADTEEKNLSMGGLNIKSSQVLAFSGVLMYLQKTNVISNFAAHIGLFDSNYKTKRKTTLMLKGMLAFFLLLLLVNFMAFSFYHDQVTELDTSMEMATDQQNRFKELESSVNRKQGKLELLNATASSKTTFYLDHIAREMPKGIQLDQITYQPLEMPVREDKPLRYSHGKILISGNSIRAEEFSGWIVSLEKFEWIKSVETTQYGSEKGSRSNFILEINIDDPSS